MKITIYGWSIRLGAVPDLRPGRRPKMHGMRVVMGT
jgi:hypothetical protein